MHILKRTASTLVKSTLFGIAFFSIVILVTLGYITYAVYFQYNDRILPNITVNNYPVANFNQKDFDSLIEQENEKIRVSVVLTLLYEKGEIATFSATDLEVKYDSQPTYDLAVQIGRPITNPQKLLQAFSLLVMNQKQSLSIHPNYKLEKIIDELNQKGKVYDTAPEDALFDVEGNKVVAFKIEKYGLKLDKDKTLGQVKRYFSHEPSSYQPTTIAVKTISVKPKITLNEMDNFGIVEEIGRGTSNFAHSAPPRIFNIKLVSSRIHGVLVPKGETFSFNKSAGEISSKTGYQAGYAIISGQTVLSDGGGVCQESTTIFRAALNSGLPITQWKNHSYRVRYYENDSGPGFDATVYAPSVDLKFKNDTPAHILIQSEISNGTILTVTLFGKKDGRVASVSASRVWGVIPPPEPLYKDDPTLAQGITKQIDFPAWGAKAAFDYKVTRGNEVLQERTFTSVYRPWQAVFLVGKGQ